MEKFETPKVEIIAFDAEDVISASGDNCSMVFPICPSDTPYTGDFD